MPASVPRPPAIFFNVAHWVNIVRVGPVQRRGSRPLWNYCPKPRRLIWTIHVFPEMVGRPKSPGPRRFEAGAALNGLGIATAREGAINETRGDGQGYVS